MAKKDLNLCQFIGRLGKDPEVRRSDKGTMATFSMACSDDYRDKNTGETVQQTNWINIVVFGRLAEIIEQYVTKGSQIYIGGKQRTRKYQDNNGQDRYVTETVASEMQMLDSKGGGESNENPTATPRPAQTNGPDNNFDDGDCIPF